LLVRASHKGT